MQIALPRSEAASSASGWLCRDRPGPVVSVIDDSNAIWRGDHAPRRPWHHICDTHGECSCVKDICGDCRPRGKKSEHELREVHIWMGIASIRSRDVLRVSHHGVNCWPDSAWPR